MDFAKQDRTHLEVSLHAIGLSLLGFAPLLFITAWLRLLFSPLFLIPIEVSVSAAFLLSLVILFVSLREKSTRLWRIVSLFGLAMSLLLCMLVSSAVFDTSYDGQMYHQAAVLELALGWDVLREPMISEAELGSGMGRIAFLLSHYPKGLWMASASLVELGSDLKVGKAVHLFLVIGSALVGYTTLRTTLALSFASSLLISVLLLSNPVISAQLLTYYHDGVIASLLIGVFFLGFRVVVEGKRTERWVLVLASILLYNIKFTATVYLALLFVLAFFVVLICRKDDLRRTLDTVLTASILGLLVFGYNPYVYNLQSKSSLFYPVSSYPMSGITPAKESLIKDQLPADFVTADRFEKLAKSLFARTENIYRPRSSTLKFPFSVRMTEWEEFSDPDVRLAGFGPLFALSLCAAAILAFPVFSLHWRRLKLPMLFGFFIVASTLLNPEAWWARYVPQLWAFPILLVFVVRSLSSDSRAAVNPWFRRYGTLLALLMLINGVGVAFVSLGSQIQNSQLLTRHLEQMTKEQHSVQFLDFRSNAERLRQFSVPFEEVEKLRCALPTPIPFSRASYCPPGPQGNEV